MAKENDGFVFFPSYLDAIKDLPDADQLSAFRSLCSYGIYGEEPQEITPVAKAIFILTKPTIDSSKKKYAQAKANGAKGGAPKGNQNAKKTTEKQPKNNLNKDKDKDKERDKDSDKDKECIIADKPPRSRFIPPSVEEVREYCQERNNSVDPERFVDYYNSNGWKVGRNKMKDWKSAVHTWEKSEYNKKQEGYNGGTKEDKSKYYLAGQIVL